MEKQERINYLVSLLYELDPEGIYDGDYKIKNATLDSICEYPGGGYFRIKSWLEKKVEEKQNELGEKFTPKSDMELAREQFQKCFELMQSRNKKYGDSWKVLTIQSLANLCEMKLHRIANMQSDNLDPKIEDELVDTANYMIFALIKLTNKD